MIDYFTQYKEYTFKIKTYYFFNEKLSVEKDDSEFILTHTLLDNVLTNRLLKLMIRNKIPFITYREKGNIKFINTIYNASIETSCICYLDDILYIDQIYNSDDLIEENLKKYYMNEYNMWKLISNI